MALVHHAHCDQVAIAEVLADLHSLGRNCVCRFEVAVREVLEHHGEAEVSALDAVELVAFEQPLSACEPSTRGRRFAAHQQVETDPPRTARSSRYLARVEME